MISPKNDGLFHSLIKKHLYVIIFLKQKLSDTNDGQTTERLEAAAAVFNTETTQKIRKIKYLVNIAIVQVTIPVNLAGLR